MGFRGFLKQSTQTKVTFLAIDSADHITGKTGITTGFTMYLTKAGGTPTCDTATIAELDSTNVKGLYAVTFTATQLNTLGEFAAHWAATGMDPLDDWWEVSTYLPGEAATLQADQAVNTTKINGTTQTGRDLGASVLISSGAGAGQLDVTSGVIKANLAQILGTALTETAGQIAAAFKKWFDVATPSGTVNSIPGATAGAAGGLFIAGTNAATTVTTALTTTFTGNLTGSVASVTSAPVKKNTALAKFQFLMTDSTNHAPATLLAVTVTRSIDGGAFAAGTLSAVTEIGAGMYSVDFGAADLNGNVIVLRATAAASDDTFERLITFP